MGIDLSALNDLLNPNNKDTLTAPPPPFSLMATPGGPVPIMPSEPVPDAAPAMPLPQRMPQAMPAPAPEPMPPVDIGPPKLDLMNPAPALSLQDQFLADFSPAKTAEAQAEAEKRKSGLGWAQFAAGIGDAMAGRSPAQTAQNFQNIREGIDKSTVGAFDARKKAFLENVAGKQAIQKAQQEADDQNPDSDASKRFRATLKANVPEIAAKYGDSFDKLTAGDQKNVFGVVETMAKIAERKESAAMRNMIAGQNASDRKDKKASENDNKDAMALENTLAKGWTARSGQAGMVQNKINAAEAAEALLEQAKHQKGGLDSRQYEELAQSAGRLIASGGAQASARIEALVPHTAWGRVQTLGEYLSNAPRGQDFEKFTDRLAETIHREKDLAVNQKRQFQIESLAAHDRLRSSNPDLYNRILDSKGITPDMIDEHGRYKAPKAEASAGGGTVQMKDPSGKIRNIPADQVEAAKAAGGTVVGQ